MKENENRVRQHRELREKLSAAAIILLIIVMLVAVWKIVSYMVDDWKSRSFEKALWQSVIIIEDEAGNEPDGTEPEQEKETGTKKETETK